MKIKYLCFLLLCSSSVLTILAPRAFAQNVYGSNLIAYDSIFGGTGSSGGNFVIAAGYGNYAATSAAAFGQWSSSSLFSLSAGLSTYATQRSIASGQTTQALRYSAAFGHQTKAEDYSVAGGSISEAYFYSVAIGNGALATGATSQAFGYRTVAKGDSSTAAGSDTTAISYASFVIGQGNDPEAVQPNKTLPNWSGNTWYSQEPLFIVGNGTDVAPHNAFVVYKSGNAKVSGDLEVAGKLTLPAQGDISMGEFGN